ncbi:hypothetical protein H4R35_000008 [Dimargaris xerosporica]|nr:hypothetical protein H4R35_000008 [Dimargaris xerosporica]
MEVTIPAPALRSFSRVVQCLAKIGDYLTLEAKRNKLLLSSVNASCSAFALFTLSRQYFDQYHLIANAASGPEAACRCRVLIKRGQTTHDIDTLHGMRLVNQSITAIFRSKNSVDKNVQVCQIALDADPREHLTTGDELPHHRLAIKLACKHGIAKHYRLYYEPTEALYAVYAKHTCSHRWQVSPKLMTEWASHFNPRLEEITMVCTPEAVILRSFSEGGFLTVADGTTAKDAIKQSLQTQLQIDPEDFDVYSVVHHMELTFSFREFRAILAFAEQTNLQLSAYFDVPGRPILFAIQSTDHMAADFVLATLTEAMSTTSASSTQQSNAMPFSAMPRDQASHALPPHPRPISPEIGSSLVSASPALTLGSAGPLSSAPTAATPVPPPSSSAPKTPLVSQSQGTAPTALPPTPTIRRLDFESPTTGLSSSTAPTDCGGASMVVDSPALLHTPSSTTSADQRTSSLPPTRSFASTMATPLSVFHHRSGPAKPLPPSSSASGSISQDHPHTPLPAHPTRPALSPWTTETVVAPTPGVQASHSMFDSVPERPIQLPPGPQDHSANASALSLAGSARSEDGSDSDELEATPPRSHQPRSLFG